MYFVHANGTLYSINATSHRFENVCDKPSFLCPLPVLAINAARDRLVYKVDVTWLKPFIPINEALYMIDAEIREIVWSQVDSQRNTLPMPYVNFDNKTISQQYNGLANPSETTKIDIEQGASDQRANISYLPKKARVPLGTKNKLYGQIETR